jgi:hypothetical protein
MAVRTNILLKLSNFANGLITFAKLQNIATNKILGRITAGSGVIEELDIANYSNKLIPLTTTIADCENTANPTDIVTVTVPASIVAIGDIIVIETFLQRLQNSGATNNNRLSFRINSGEVQAVTLAVSNNASIYRVKSTQKFIVKSIISNVVTTEGLFNASTADGIMETSSFSGGGTTANQSATTSAWSNNTFTYNVSNTVSLRVDWTTANVNSWIRVQQAQAYIIKKAV